MQYGTFKVNYLISDSLVDFEFIVHHSKGLMRIGLAIENKGYVPSLPFHVIEIYKCCVQPKTVKSKSYIVVKLAKMKPI